MPAQHRPPGRRPPRPCPPQQDDWPMFRANAAGTATVSAAAFPRRPRSCGGGVCPAAASPRRCVRAAGSSWAGPTARCGPWMPPDGKLLWQASSHAAVLHPPAYWNGRVVFGSCDGRLVLRGRLRRSRVGTRRTRTGKAVRQHHGSADVGVAAGRRGGAGRRRDRLHRGRQHGHRRRRRRRRGHCPAGSSAGGKHTRWIASSRT